MAIRRPSASAPRTIRSRSRSSRRRVRWPSPARTAPAGQPAETCDELQTLFGERGRRLPLPGATRSTASPRPCSTSRTGPRRSSARARSPARRSRAPAGRALVARLALFVMSGILVVCTGNVCRSPMAEGFLRAALVERLGDAAPVVTLGGYRRLGRLRGDGRVDPRRAGARRRHPSAPRPPAARRDARGRRPDRVHGCGTSGGHRAVPCRTWRPRRSPSRSSSGCSRRRARRVLSRLASAAAAARDGTARRRRAEDVRDPLGRSDRRVPGGGGRALRPVRPAGDRAHRDDA